MKYFIGVTDGDWFRFLAERRPDEVNFWRPMGKVPFRALEVGAPFLFKLHKPEHKIVGGGFFAGYRRTPLSKAWDDFGIANGAASYGEMRESIRKYRESRGLETHDPEIGCIALVEPFFLPEREWIPAPPDWADSIVSGKRYDIEEPVGRMVWDAVTMARLGQQVDAIGIADRPRRAYDGPILGKAYLRRARLGQGAFRLLTLENYGERCCITGENTVPVLEAAHIRPIARDGDHALSNGLLMRADLHILYDRGLIGVDPDYRIRVSGGIREQYLNGKVYYAHDGAELRSLPEDEALQPDRERLAWHMETVFVR
jgi:putative restriction endonuclease